MNRQTKALRQRARRPIASAAILPRQDPGDSVSRLYGGAFYAEAAPFCNRGQLFRQHRVIEAAVHRDLLKTERWPKEAGVAFSRLLSLHATADYGGAIRTGAEDAALAPNDGPVTLEEVEKMGNFFPDEGGLENQAGG